MGIQGLLPLLKDITKKQHIKDFKKCTVAIDGYGWLYKGAYCCPRELCEGEPTDRCFRLNIAQATLVSLS